MASKHDPFAHNAAFSQLPADAHLTNVTNAKSRDYLIMILMYDDATAKNKTLKQLKADFDALVVAKRV